MTASVIISVYYKEWPARLDACLESIVSQTRQPDEIILVKDGPLGMDLDHVIDRFLDRYPQLFKVISLPENLGLIAALNKALESCESDYVLRMDTDDIAMPERFERQLDYMASHPEVAVSGTAMYEFLEDPARPRLKPVKVSHEAIVHQLPWRNPVNHPTVCFKTRAVKAAGGYPDLKYLEDYYLWAKLITLGFEFHNLPEPLHLYRFDDETLKRRSGWENFKNECTLRFWMYRHGLMGLPALLGVITLQVLLRCSPTGLQRRLWRATRQPVSPP